jgi:glycerophosphoryl diester phosphodiesterase
MNASLILPSEQRPPWDQLAPMPVSRASHRRPTIVGHRGASGLAPENTLAAFQVAADLNIDGVEFDVQRSRDGHLVVFHDDEVNRITGSQGAVYDLTLAELKGLDAGAKFDPRFRGERIPTLQETFEFLRQTNLLLFVELKDPWRFPGVEEAVAGLIRRYDLVDRVQVRSFYHGCLHTLFRFAPEIPLSELWFDRLPDDDEVTFKVIDALHRLFTPENIAHIHDRGQQVTAWTVDDLDEAHRLMAAGIDSLTTNHPDRLLALYES